MEKMKTIYNFGIETESLACHCNMVSLIKSTKKFKIMKFVIFTITLKGG